MGLILFVAELGSGFGHVRRLLPIARAAAAQGHRPLFFVGNPREVEPLLGAAGLPVEPAPVVPARRTAAPPAGAVASSFADVLGVAGFADAAWLLDMTVAWDAALARLRPGAVIAELSPFLSLACFGGQVPVLSVGHGFVLPPPHLPRFPPLWEGPAIHQEPALLEHVATVCRHRSRPAPDALPALLAGSAHAITGLDELDPYRADRRQPAVGVPGLDVDPPGARAPAEDVFAYLLGEAPMTVEILRALATSGLRGRAYVRRGGEAHRAALDGSPIAWLDRPVPAREALGRARMVVHHGSMLMSEEALAAGRPQIVAPLYLEHLLTARALAALGVAAIIRPRDGGPAIARALAAPAADAAVPTAARAFAEGYWRGRGDTPADVPARLLAQVVPSGRTTA